MKSINFGIVLFMIINGSFCFLPLKTGEKVLRYLPGKRNTLDLDDLFKL
jgi:hypothetical protein